MRVGGRQAGYASELNGIRRLLGGKCRWLSVADAWYQSRVGSADGAAVRRLLLAGGDMGGLGEAGKGREICVEKRSIRRRGDGCSDTHSRRYPWDGRG